MQADLQAKLARYIGDILSAINYLLPREVYDQNPNWQAFTRLSLGCRHIAKLLGTDAEAWKEVLEQPREGHWGDLRELAGALEILQQTMAAGLLLHIEDFVMAHAFDDFLEQADYLFSQGYYVPAGVLGRAVLEEHLQKWCRRENVTLTMTRPTINDFNTELYKAKHLNKAEMHHVTAMAAVGNDATHDPANVKKEDVERLLRDARSFIALH